MAQLSPWKYGDFQSMARADHILKEWLWPANILACKQVVHPVVLIRTRYNTDYIEQHPRPTASKRIHHLVIMSVIVNCSPGLIILGGRQFLESGEALQTRIWPNQPYTYIPKCIAAHHSTDLMGMTRRHILWHVLT